MFKENPAYKDFKGGEATPEEQKEAGTKSHTEAMRDAIEYGHKEGDDVLAKNAMNELEKTIRSEGQENQDVNIEEGGKDQETKENEDELIRVCEDELRLSKNDIVRVFNRFIYLVEKQHLSPEHAKNKIIAEEKDSKNKNPAAETVIELKKPELEK